MINAALVRGAFLNTYECQNFIFNSQKTISLTAFSSLYPLHRSFSFPVTRLASIADLEHLPVLEKTTLFKKAVKFMSNRILGDSQILFGLEKYMRDFDVVDTADPHYYYSYQLARLRKAGGLKKLIVTYCETIPFNNESIRRKKYIKYFTLNQADHFICHTERSKEALLKEGVKENKISIVKLGVDLHKFKRANRQSSKSFTVLFVGRLVAEKGILDLYQSFRQVVQRNKHVKLRIVGDGPLRSSLDSSIRADNLDQYVSIEQKDYYSMPDVYADADIFVLPSKTVKTGEEQYGMAIIEAMASGLPIISSTSGAIPEVVGDAGLLIKESSSEELTSALMNLVMNSAERKSLADKAYQRAVKLYDARTAARNIDRIYEKVAKS